MRVQLLYFPGCPNIEGARAAIKAALANTGLPATFEEVDTTATGTPRSLVGWGSPTILVNGVDVAGQTAPAGASCRLYQGGGTPLTDLVASAIERLRRVHGDGENDPA